MSAVASRRLARAAAELLLALATAVALAVALTWPVAAHLDQVILGGGELGGWLWRQWWHFQEADAIGVSDMSLLQRLSGLIALGRYPETGNILDVLLLGYPLDQLVGFPVAHNLEVLAILVGNGLAGYALARAHTRSILAALAASTLAIVNPLVIQDIDKTGLRQVLLWWLLLYPVFLGRAERTRRPIDGALAGLVFALAAAFYWFYGLFAAMFTAIRLLSWLWRERPSLRRTARWLGPMVLVGGLGALLFLAPYFSADREAGGQGGVSQLPELSFFLPFPSYDTIAAAPLRPQSYRENVLSSIHRTIDSAWPADYVVNPGHGVKALPIAAFFLGVLPAVFVRRARTWLVVWGVFYLGTLGPFLKLGALRDTAEVVRLGDFVVRLPYAWMFQYIPGMSRMFAPYRMASVVVVASIALLAIVLDRLPRSRRLPLALLTGALIVMQPFYRFDLGPITGGGRPAMWRVPTQVSAFSLPDWYAALDPDGHEGIIELPLDQQQDLVCAYQSFHHQKVYRSWATPPAVPPVFRDEGGGAPAARLRWLAQPEPRKDPTLLYLRALTEDPTHAPTAPLQDQDIIELMASGDYRWLVVHERGYYLVEPTEGGVYYRSVVRHLAQRLGIQPTERTELQAADWPGKRAQFPSGPAWVPWASREVQLPTARMPSRYSMAVFDLSEWRGHAQEAADQVVGSAPAP